MRAAPCMIFLTGCVMVKQPADIPGDPGPAVLVGSASLGQPINDVARHPWVAVRDEVSWDRWEVMCCPSDPPRGLGTVKHRRDVDPLSDYGGGGGDVRVHGTFTGERAKRMTQCVREKGPEYPHRHHYLVWPGPNSNTFVDWLLRVCDIPVDLPVASIGKDYRGAFGVSGTSGGTGVQMETPLVGVRVGATEGVVFHFFTFSLGIDWWPPAIVTPVGRVGFDDR